MHVDIDPEVMSRSAFGATFLERCRRLGSGTTHVVVEITATDLLSPAAALLAHPLELPVDGVKIELMAMLRRIDLGDVASVADAQASQRSPL